MAVLAREDTKTAPWKLVTLKVDCPRRNMPKPSLTRQLRQKGKKAMGYTIDPYEETEKVAKEAAAEDSVVGGEGADSSAESSILRRDGGRRYVTISS